jgi:hypothetical protein
LHRRTLLGQVALAFYGVEDDWVRPYHVVDLNRVNVCLVLIFSMLLAHGENLT